MQTSHQVESLLPSHSAPPVWRPLLTGAAAKRAGQVILAIATGLRNWQPAGATASSPNHQEEGASLAGGQSGFALFYAYLSQSCQADCAAHLIEQVRQGAADTAISYLEQAFEQLPLLAPWPSLYSGFTGIAWATAHLQGRFLAAEADVIDPSIDEALLAHLNQSPWQTDYDLIVGLVGMGVYALERLPNLTALHCLERVIHHLAATAQPQAGGLTWWTNPAWLPAANRERSPQGYYNLGLAHGVPGVIAFLGATCAALPSGDPLADQARALLNGAVVWLLAQRQPAEVGSAFTYWLEPGQGRGPARLAWCYGDPGVAIALLAAARHVSEPAWEAAAVEIALQATARPTEQAGVHDAGLCHGAAGLGHIFNRFYQATGHEQFANAARFWFQQTLTLHQPGQGIGGYQAWGAGADGELTWVEDPGLLGGAAGIGLALLAAITPVEPAWDRMLLADVKPGKRYS